MTEDQINVDPGKLVPLQWRHYKILVDDIISPWTRPGKYNAITAALLTIALNVLILKTTD